VPRIEIRVRSGTVRTKPIPLRVLPPAESDGTPGQGDTGILRTDPYAGLPALSVASGGCEPSPIIKTRHAVLALFGPLFFALVCAAQGFRPRIERATQTRRRRRVLERAVRRLRRAKAPSPGDPDTLRRAIVMSLSEYIGVAFGVAHAGLTPDEARQVLEAHGVDPELSARLGAVFERSFKARYHGTGAEDDPARDSEAAINVLQQVDGQLRGTGKGAPPGVPAGRERLRAGVRGSLLALIIVVGLGAAPGSAKTAATRRFIWQEANWRMARARSAGDFLLAARTYEELVDMGVRNGPVFHNLGIALLAAGEFDAAADAFLRCERYAGSSPDIRRGLRHALVESTGRGSASLPWQRLPLFWHYGLSGTTRVTVSACAFSALWIAWGLRRLRRQRAARICLVLAALVFGIFGSSALTTWRLEAEVVRGTGDREVVVQRR